MTETQVTLLLQEVAQCLGNVEGIIMDINEMYIDLNLQMDTLAGNCSKLVELLRQERLENYRLRKQLKPESLTAAEIYREANVSFIKEHYKP